jgi:ankyrin repeat protein
MFDHDRLRELLSAQNEGETPRIDWREVFPVAKEASIEGGEQPTSLAARASSASAVDGHGEPSGNVSLVLLLLTIFLSLFISLSTGRTCLVLAAEAGLGGSLWEFLSETESLDARELDSAAFWAVPDLFGRTAMHWAAKVGDEVLLRAFLRSQEADFFPSAINAQTQTGETPLHWAALGGSLACCRLLLNAHTNPLLRSKHASATATESDGGAAGALAVDVAATPELAGLLREATDRALEAESTRVAGGSAGATVLVQKAPTPKAAPRRQKLVRKKR